jgi:HSP20 family protein
MFRRNPQSTALARRPEGGLTHWSPWEEMEDLRRHMDDLFSRAFGYTPLSRLIPTETMGFEPAVDIYETDDNVLFFAALPGFTPDSIHIEATQDSLTIQGECKPCYADEKAVAHRQSWLSESGNFSVSYSLPTEIDPNKVKATYRNGVLQLEMPKTEPSRTKPVKVNVSAGS